MYEKLVLSLRSIVATEFHKCLLLEGESICFIPKESVDRATIAIMLGTFMELIKIYDASESGEDFEKKLEAVMSEMKDVVERETKEFDEKIKKMFDEKKEEIWRKIQEGLEDARKAHEN